MRELAQPELAQSAWAPLAALAPLLVGLGPYLPAVPSGVAASGAPAPAAPAAPPAPPAPAPAPAAEGWLRACSLSHRLCVHAAPGTSASQALAALAAADRGWDALTGALSAPEPDGAIDGRWHIYLVDAVEGGSQARLLEGLDPRARFDRASSFALVDRAIPPGCALDLALARALVRGSLWRAAPATDEGSARAEAETLARLAVPCAGAPDDADAFQAQPEHAVVDPFSPPYDRGASMFFGWLDATFGARPGAMLVATWALAPTRTPADSARWTHTPTGFDVLRVSLKNALWSGSTLDDVFVRFAVARASMTPAVRLAWHLPWPARARRLASPVPVAPTGASYVLVDRAGAAMGATAKLRVEAQWEDYGRMRWVVVKRDSAGRTLGDIVIPSLDKATTASMTIESLDAASSVLVVGVNVGSTEHPFDPAQGEWEPHGWLLTLAAE